MIESMATLSFHLFVFTSACLALQTCCQVQTAKLSTVWTNQLSQINSGFQQAAILARPLEFQDLSFCAGFYCVSPCTRATFGVYTIISEWNSLALDEYHNSALLTWSANYGRQVQQNVTLNFTGDGGLTLDEYHDSVLVAWSANHDRQVQQNATLNFTGDGDLVLRDADGSFVWSSNTSGRSVVGMNMTESGNLVLFDHNNETVWQSFDHPVDVLLPGQRLLAGKSLTPRTSSNDSTTSNQLNFTLRHDGVYAFAGHQEPQLYYSSLVRDDFTNPNVTQMFLVNGSLTVADDHNNGSIIFPILYTLPPTSSLQFIRFGSDGHLRLYEFIDKWNEVTDILGLDPCHYPTICGNYGICSGGQCSCPMASSTSGTYFRQIDDQRPNLGCILDTPISCQSMEYHQLTQVHNVSYFNYIDQNAGVLTDEDSCKKACLRNCSCQAALFQRDKYASKGSCLLVSEVLSLVGSSRGTAFMKVQTTKPPQRGKNQRVLLPYTLGGGTAAFVLFAIVFAIIRWRRNEMEADEDEFGELPGMPTKFSFQSLKVATKDFSSKIGEGGFGAVFKGVLGDELIAVKHLHRASQGTKDFLAEIQTIGNLHHINLVRLIGFCTEKMHMLLVYEYMSRGSLDKWIYYADNKAPLDWHTRRKIITDIAKGLSYLHEDCRQRIAHLDIKPQNILLDDNFDAKVADFGLSKLIDRDQSRVVTRMRGTPGYMAPEWLTSQITEKVDVYSFGVVVLEIICGRKNLDYSQPESSIQLISLLQEKAKNGKLEDLIERKSLNILMHKEEVVEMMNLAIWCLQSDAGRRPAMSLVVKVMEGERQVEPNLECNFFDLSALNAVPVGEANFNLSTLPIASALSSPR